MPDNRVYFTVVDAPDRAQQSALGRLLLRQMAADISGLPLAQFCIAAEPSGRLTVCNPDGAPSEVFVSMAHSGPLLACAATLLGPIGVDIERPRPGRDLTGIADAAFGPAEIRRCACGGPAAFYRIWTLREAIAKAMGEGLALVADRSDRAAEGPDEGSWRWQDWCLAHYRQPGDVCLALALRPRDATVGEIDWHDVTARGA